MVCYIARMRVVAEFKQKNIDLVPFCFVGIGDIGSPSFNFQPSIPCIQWAEPSFVSSDVTNLFYFVLVGGANLSPIYAITSEVEYCTELTPCQEYTVTVTPVSTSPDYTGNSSSVTDTIPGGMEVHMTPLKRFLICCYTFFLTDNYRFKGPCSSEVMFESDAMNVSCTFKCQVCVAVIVHAI